MKTFLEEHAAMQDELNRLIARWRRRKIRLHTIGQRLSEASSSLEALERYEAKAVAERRRAEAEKK